MGRVTRRYVDGHGLIVSRGPFAGLTYPLEAVGRAGILPAKLLGSYEEELHPHLVSISCDVFVDIGSGDGYFCVGMARLLPGTRVIGFEPQTAERRLARRLAALNGADVEYRAAADHAALNQLPTGRLTVLCDIEGAELHLLDPSRAPRLRDAELLVELHPWTHPRLLQTLLSRFRLTHTHEIVTGVARDVSSYPELCEWDLASATIAISEGRPSYAQWLILTPHRDTSP